VIEAHLPVLVVVVLLLGAIVTVLGGGGRGSWLVALAAVATSFFLALRLLEKVVSDGSVRELLGDWPAPWGIELHVDLLGAIIITLVTGVGLVTTFYSYRSVRHEIAADRVNLFYSLWLLAITGMVGICVTGDVFNIYVLLEVSSLAMYSLVAMGKDRDRRALPAAFNYLVLGSIAASFILIGIGYLYMLTGTLNIDDLHQRLSQLPQNRTLETAFAFLMVGLSIKVALFPLHLWLPEAYSRAPTAVAALLSATATKVGIYITFRFVFSVFGTDTGFLGVSNSTILLTCAALAIVFGSLSAARQKSLSRILAYSSVAQIGYIVLGLALLEKNAVEGALLHTVFHALMKGGLFMVAGIYIYRLGSNDLDRLRGIGRKMPWTSAALVAGGLGMIGVPGTAGFISKLYLLRGTIASGEWLLTAAILLGSIFAAIYVWRVLEIVYLQKATDDREIKEAPLELLIPTWTLLGLSIAVGLHSSWVVELLEGAAAAMLGGNG